MAEDPLQVSESISESTSCACKRRFASARTQLCYTSAFCAREHRSVSARSHICYRATYCVRMHQSASLRIHICYESASELVSTSLQVPEAISVSSAFCAREHRSASDKSRISSARTHICYTSAFCVREHRAALLPECLLCS